MDNPNQRESPDSSSERVLIAAPPIEAWVDKKNKQYHLSIAVSGMDQKDLQVTLQGNNLTVSGERKDGPDSRDAHYLQREFSRWRLHRTIAIPEGVEVQKLKAEYSNGILEITAPLRESALPRQIEVTNSEKARGASAS
jgi:HSP20 family protein